MFLQNHIDYAASEPFGTVFLLCCIVVAVGCFIIALRLIRDYDE